MKILYEDNHIIVIEKQAGILTQNNLTCKESLVSLLEEYLNKDISNKKVYLGIVHRLDKPVGGVIVFTKTYEANKILSKDISNRQFLKEYLAVTYGNFESKKGLFKDYIMKNNRLNYSKIVNNNKFAKEAILEYNLLKTIYLEENINLVKVKLITGRHHQIRCQFASRGLYLLGDRKYNKKFKYDGKIKYIALWSYKLEFLHPISKKKLSFILKPHNYYPFNIQEFNI